MTPSLAPHDAQTGASPRLTIWAAPVAFLFGLWLMMVFSSGGFQQSQWLLPGLGVAFLALVVGATHVHPSRPGQLSLAVLGLFALHTVWTVLSAVWAPSLNNVWDEAGRTAVYLLALAVALVCFTDPDARRVTRYVLLAGALTIVGAATWHLGFLDVTGGTDGAATGPGLASLFIEDRFAYPTSYPNGAAALYLVLFWPLLWIAADPREMVPVRGLALATTSGLLSLTILAQSRGALWAGVITLVVLFLFSPVRLRTLLHLSIPAALAVWSFPALNSYWSLGPETVGGDRAATTTLVGMAIAAITGVVIALVDRRVTLPRRLTTALGAAVLVVTIGLAAYGLVLFDREVGEPTRWLGDWWRSFTAEQESVIGTSAGEASQDEEAAGSRFLIVSSSGRWDIWRVAWQDFRDAPLLGVGAGNYVYTYDQFRRRVSSSKPRQPHSLTLRLLSETGVFGTLLLLGSLGLGLGGILWPRFSAGWHGLRRGPPAGRWGADPRAYAWEFAIAAGITYWFVHANVDWLWHLPGVSLAPLLLFALGMASVDARAGILWPRLAKTSPPTAEPRTRPHAWFSLALAVTALVVLTGLAFPYLSLRFQETALGRMNSDGESALGAARRAARLQPVDPGPLLVEAEIHRFSAAEASGETALDELALSLNAYMRAVERNPSDWALHYRAGMGALRMLEASLGTTPTSGQDTPPERGDASGTAPLATLQTPIDAQELRALSVIELKDLARGFLMGARERSPLSHEIQEALEGLDSLAVPGETVSGS